MAEELIKKILVSIDGSNASQKALDYAGWVSGKTGASIILLHVIDADKFKTSYEAMDRFQPDWEDKIKGTDDIKRYSPFFEEELSCMIEDPVCKKGGNLLKEMAKYAEKYNAKTKTMMKLGKTVDTIIQVAKEENCDQIIVGKTGLTGIRKLAMGSAAEDVAQYAHCRVTVLA